MRNFRVLSASEREAYVYRSHCREIERYEERIKALEEALRDALPRLENCVKDHVWHTQRPPVPHYIVNIRALLKEAGQ